MISATWNRPLRSAIPTLGLFVLGLATNVAAQQAPATLSLGEAIHLARMNNPDFLATANDATESDWAVRAAYGALLPSANVSTGMQYQGEGSQRLGIFTSDDLGVSATTGYLLSSYSLGLSYRLDGEVLLRPAQARARRDATHARIDAAAFALASEVTRQYLAVLAAQDAVALAEQELARANENLKLAEARVAVGSAIPLEAKQAEVERGRAEVELLKARNLQRTEQLRLMERLGITLERDVELTTKFTVFEPTWRLEDLLATAMSSHPQLRALRSEEEAGRANLKVARSRYLPSLSLQLGWSGYTRQATNEDFLIDQEHLNLEMQRQNCVAYNDLVSRLVTPLPAQDCSVYQLTDARRAEILARNDVFPFNFSNDPFAAQVTISLPIFNGFIREQQVQSAQVAIDDVRHQLRKEELRLRTEIGMALQNVQTAYQTFELESRNRELADEQLRLAQERYRVGAISFVELLEAETIKARADRSYLAAVYAFHEGLAALEAAVGHPLDRPQEGF